MYLKELSLVQFRNFDYVEKVEFPGDSLMVAAAPNATGKTNFIESVVVLLRGKSFRASIEECVAWGGDGFAVQGIVRKEEGESQISVQYNKESRKLRIEEEGAPVSPVTFYAAYPIVLFLPEDTFLFYRGPAQRRNFFNHVLVSQRQYLSALVQYQRSLRQRNAALKSADSKQEVQIWTELLQKHAQVVWQYRQMLVDFLASHVSDIYQEVSGEAQKFVVQFRPGADEPENFARILDEAWEHEKKYNYTMYGPHRDDLEITVNGRLVQSVLSRGQMRGLTVALKVATYRFLKQATDENPIVLFDEVLSELDKERQDSLLEHLPKAQVLLTCTTLPDSLRERADAHMLDLRAIIAQEKVEEEKVAAAV